MRQLFRITSRLFCVLSVALFILHFQSIVAAQNLTISAYPISTISAVPGPSANCGEKPPPLEIYEQASYYALVFGFGLVFLATLVSNNKARIGLLASSAISLMIWGYIFFLVDLEQIRKNMFNYNTEAENTLANIAEAQERYKSERGTYLKDLNELRTHIAGSHGIDKCVNILEFKADSDRWTAIAQHLSSSQKIYWDSKVGSSLKKG